jgi:glycosyltransferase involved in cell wall biosynthesis
MRKKIFLVVGSLGAGGSERVYWLLSQYFNNEKYDVSVVYLSGHHQCFSADIKGIRFINLNTIKASKSFFKLLKLLRDEKPDAVFSTTDHINILIAMVGCFVKVPNLIARASNNPFQMRQYYDFKARFYNFFTRFLFFRFDFIVCQSEEMLREMAVCYNIPVKKLTVIHNPILPSHLLKNGRSISGLKRLVVVSRLRKEKGLLRLLEIVKDLPTNYVLTIVGDGPLMKELKTLVCQNNLCNRVTFTGEISNVALQIARNDLLVLSSFTEGFPNVVLESLSVGVPVVTFRVGGISKLIREGFNGFVAEQNDVVNLKRHIIRACNQTWHHEEIKADIYNRFALDKIGKSYEMLILN